MTGTGPYKLVLKYSTTVKQPVHVMSICTLFPRFSNEWAERLSYALLYCSTVQVSIATSFYLYDGSRNSTPTPRPCIYTHHT
jgi:hypothetical protein